MIGRNKELYDSMIVRGYRFKRGDHYEHFVDSEMKYVEYPVGYIRGPHYCDNGNPRPIQMSVNGKDGWHQRNFTSSEDAEAWAIKKQDEILTEKNAEVSP